MCGSMFDSMCINECGMFGFALTKFFVVVVVFAKETKHSVNISIK